MAAGKAIKESPLSPATQELVALRVSQINGCAVCIDMHTKDAAAAGESSVRLNLVAAWREATVFTEAERAALALAEEGTRVADGVGGVSDEVWESAAKHYDEEQLTALVIAVSFMNAANRMNVITQQPAGDYRPGQFH
jgi:AhpD family alkylhydroperoxidase